MWNVVQIKTQYSNPFTSFFSILLIQYLTGERVNKTTLFPLISLQTEAVRTLEYNKTKTTVLYSKRKILEILNLFQLSVAKFMYSFYNGGLPNHFDNYFAEIASVHKYQTRLASLQKYYLPKMKTPLGQLSLKYIGPKIWSNITEKLKSSSPYSFGKKYKSPAILPDFLLIFVLYACHILFDLRFIFLSYSVILR